MTNLELTDDEVEMLLAILNREKDRLKEIIDFPDDFKGELERARWDLSHIDKMINQLTTHYGDKAQ